MATNGPTRPLTPEEKKRLERLQRTRQNRRGRVNPATMPDRLARTSAFVPRRYGLITDSNFTRIYEVPGYSVVEVKGRELGSQHRDALVAVFRLPRTKVTVQNPDRRATTDAETRMPAYSVNDAGQEIAHSSPAMTDSTAPARGSHQKQIKCTRGNVIKMLTILIYERMVGCICDVCGNGVACLRESWQN